MSQMTPMATTAPDDTAMRSCTPNVLFVDDEPHVLAGIADTLHGLNVRVLTAGGPSEALEILTREPVAVVVSDERMPGHSGTVFLGEVRRRHPQVVRMVLSGSADPQLISQAVNHAGVFRYLLKPCTPADLILAVEQGLEAHAIQQPGTAESRVDLSIDEALAGLRMAMQPIYASHSGEIVAHEALLRLPSHMDAGPADLIQAAYHEGRLWEVERAVRTCIAARMPFRPAGSDVFINVHPHSLLDPQLYSRRAPLGPHARAIVLEITERGSLTDIEDVRQRIMRLRELGYRVAIDDMGSGHSGLNAFTTILPDFVKFDRELISSMHRIPAKLKLVSSIVTVCRELGIETIAEGIEHQQDLVAARDMGCNGLQGYLLGRPADAFHLQPFSMA